MRVACRQCAWRAFCRWATYAGGGRADLPDGCDESFDLSFYREILSWRRENDAHCQRVLEAARAIMLDGASLWDVRVPMLALAAISAALLAVGASLFKWTPEG